MKNFHITLTINVMRYNMDITLMPFRWQVFNWAGIFKLGPVEVHCAYASFYDLFSIGIGIDY